MKIAVCSDLHLEFGPIKLKNEEKADVLILSGDILVERDLDIFDRRQMEMGFMRNRSVMFHEFFENVCYEFPHVIYVLGNHEHYHGDFARTASELKRKLAHYTNLHILDCESFELDDVVFVGATLWTDMNKRDPLTMYSINKVMNDFKVVQNTNRQVSFKKDVLIDKPTGMTDDEFLALPTSQRFKQVFTTRPAKFSPEDAVEEHEKALAFIKETVKDIPPWKQAVVVGHHTPSFISCNARYKDDGLMNGAYHSDLSEFILDHPQIALWTHGHTHEVFDYMIGTTRVVCNPRGYDGYEELADNFKLKVIEL